MSGIAALASPCRLCPRECGVFRGRGEKGFCAMGTWAVLGRAAPHHWEEPCISGSRGSGAVFFSGCTLRCCYCQNAKISHQNRGTALNARELADVFRRLEQAGVHNISLVTATHFLPAILDALAIYRPAIPIVYNSSGFERPETLEALKNIVDVWLPDLKCFSPRLSRLLLGREDYFAVASRAVELMCRLAGPNRYDAEGLLIKGCLVRHLIIPGCTTDSLRLLQYMHEALRGTPLSLMRQYTPNPACQVPGLDRPLRDKEYRRVLSAMLSLDIPGYTQGGEAADSAYTPAFDGTGLSSS